MGDTAPAQLSALGNLDLLAYQNTRCLRATSEIDFFGITLGGGDVDLAVLHQVLVPQLLRENGLDDFALTFQGRSSTVS